MRRIKKGDRVRVIAGRERGNEGDVLGFTHDGERVLVENLNKMKRHTRPSQANMSGGIVEKEAGIHISNIQLLTPGGQPTRVQYRVNDEGRKVRYSVKHDEYID